MIFQLVLTDKLIAHLEPIASQTQQQQQPIIHPASQSLMSRIPNYNKSSYADNISIFHGREIRKVSNAKGGMGFVLQLSYADNHNIDDDDSTTTTTKTVTEGRESTNDNNIMLPKGADAISMEWSTGRSTGMVHIGNFHLRWMAFRYIPSMAECTHV